MSIKIAHTADIHIGSQCMGAGEKAEIRKHEIKNTFFKILDICLLEKVEVLLVSGDLFDSTNITTSDITDVKNKFEKLNFKIIISPGNHDPFTADSPYNTDWPENVFIFKENKINYFEFPDLNLRIFGNAFTGVYESENPLHNLNIKDDNFVNICSVHANLNASETDCYAPITTPDIATSKMDYIALGHIHKNTNVLQAGKTHYAYSGCPEGRGFDETGKKGFYIGTIAKNFCDLRFYPVCKRTHEVLNVDITDLNNEDDILDSIIKCLKKLDTTDYTQNLYKIILTGFVAEDLFVDALKLELLLSERLFFAKVQNNTKIKINEEKLKFRNDFKSTFIKKMLLKIKNSKNDYEKTINEKAFEIGLNAFSGDVKYNDN